MTAPWRLVRANPIAAGAGAAIALLLALVLWQQWRNRKTDEEIGRWKEAALRLKADSALKAGAVAKVDTQYRADTAALTSIERRYRLSVAEARRLADLLRQPKGVDTIPIAVTDSTALGAALRALALGDSTVMACRDALQTCEQRVAARDSLITVIGRQRIADRNLFAAQLRRANPRVVPYVEGLVDPTDTRTIVARGGIEWRTIGRLRIVAAGQYTTTGDHQFRALAGVRLTF